MKARLRMSVFRAKFQQGLPAANILSGPCPDPNDFKYTIFIEQGRPAIAIASIVATRIFCLDIIQCQPIFDVG